MNNTIILNEGQEMASDGIGKFLSLNQTSKRFLVITGGPGTGKTTMTLAALRKHAQHMPIVCGALSHVAKNVLYEAIARNYQCFTIAQLLGMKMVMDQTSGEYVLRPSKNAQKKIKIAEGGLLVLDEVSMIDKIMFKLLIRAAEEYNIKILCLGEQLPSLNPFNCWDVLKHN